MYRKYGDFLKHSDINNYYRHSVSFNNNSDSTVNDKVNKKKESNNNKQKTKMINNNKQKTKMINNNKQKTKMINNNKQKTKMINNNKQNMTNNPEVWGPQFWFILHNGSAQYAKKASPMCAIRMKNFILGIPFMIPCDSCKDHANTYIESKYNELDNVVSCRDNLFKFFWKFHNEVNKRQGKNKMTYREACKLYKNN